MLGDSFLLEGKVDRSHCPFSEPSPDRVTDLAGGCHIVDYINLANTIIPTLEIL